MSLAAPFLDADQLRAATFVRYVELHDTLGSTNDRAVELARGATLELPALVAARFQSAGKGRGRNQWWSTEGALTFSVLLDSEAIGVGAQNWPQLSLATAVAICDAISLEAPQALSAIKWPNDVLIEGGKVSGILIESPGGSTHVNKRLIIGVGINVNNSWRKAPQDIGSVGTALCDVTGARHDLQAILVCSLQAMQERFRQLACGSSQLPHDWQRLCWLTEQRVDVRTRNARITGVCVGIDADGALLIENENGTHRIRSGSVQMDR